MPLAIQRECRPRIARRRAFDLRASSTSIAAGRRPGTMPTRSGVWISRRAPGAAFDLASPGLVRDQLTGTDQVRGREPSARRRPRRRRRGGPTRSAPAAARAGRRRRRRERRAWSRRTASPSRAGDATRAIQRSRVSLADMRTTRSPEPSPSHDPTIERRRSHLAQPPKPIQARRPRTQPCGNSRPSLPRPRCPAAAADPLRAGPSHSWCPRPRPRLIERPRARSRLPERPRGGRVVGITLAPENPVLAGAGPSNVLHRARGLSAGLTAWNCSTWNVVRKRASQMLLCRRQGRGRGDRRRGGRAGSGSRCGAAWRSPRTRSPA